MERREGESKFEYIKKITQGKRDKTLDIDYSEWAELIYNQAYSSDVARRMFYGVERLIGVLDEEGIAQLSDSEQIEKLNEKIRELEIKKIHYQDERRVNSKYMRPLARHERILEKISDVIMGLEPLEVDKSSSYVMGKGNVGAALISDLHFGMKCDNYWNKYDMQTAKERMGELTDGIIAYCRMMNVSELNVELLGDLISGIIHKTIELENEEDVIKQTFQCAMLLASAINKLADKIDKVNVYFTCGNHGRVNPNKKESVDSENFEIAVWEAIKLRMADRDGNIREDVSFCENTIDDTFICYKVNGEYVIGVHGHLDKTSKVVNDFMKMLKAPIKEIHMGHLHHIEMKEDSDIKLIMNSTMSGVDTYAKNGRFFGRPSQTLRVFDGLNDVSFNIYFSK